MSNGAGQAELIYKVEWTPIVDDNQVLPISNLGALKKGFEAFQAEDAGDDQRSKDRWREAKMILAEESSDDTGAGAEGTVNVDDICDLEGLSRFGYGGLGWGWW